MSLPTAQIIACDREVEEYLKSMDKKVDSDDVPPPPPAKSRRRQKNQPNYEVEKYYYEIKIGRAHV